MLEIAIRCCVCVCVRNRKAKITCFQMFHSDTCPLERIKKTRLFALHVRRDRHTYITDTLMYTNIRKRFPFIHVGLKKGTYLTELLEVIHLGSRLCSMFHSKVNISLQAWLTPVASFTACRTFLLSWLGQICWPARCPFPTFCNQDKYLPLKNVDVPLTKHIDSDSQFICVAIFYKSSKTAGDERGN